MKKAFELEGQKFGRLTVIKRIPVPDGINSSAAYWLCKCECGNFHPSTSTALTKGKTVSCGCKSTEHCRELGINSNKDITGQKFGKLTAIEPTEKRYNGCVVWKCVCDCIDKNEVEVSTAVLLRGGRKSCGCLKWEDLTNQQFGRLIAIKKVGKRDTSALWLCYCDPELGGCGNFHKTDARVLTTGAAKSCGCLKKEVAAELGKFSAVDITDERFGRLVAIEKGKDRNDRDQILWKCVCDCNGKTYSDCSGVTYQPVSLLRNGMVQSCGCLQKEKQQEWGYKSIDDLQSKLNFCEGTLVQAIMPNRKLNSNNKTGVKGTSFEKGKYAAYIMFKYKKYNLGRYDTLEEATKARRRGEKEIHGKFLEWYYETYPEKQKCLL